MRLSDMLKRKRVSKRTSGRQKGRTNSTSEQQQPSTSSNMAPPSYQQEASNINAAAAAQDLSAPSTSQGASGKDTIYAMIHY